MSKAQMLANLQMLLSRVRTRAAEPRGRAGATEAVPASAAPAIAAVAMAAPAAPIPPAPPAPPATVTLASDRAAPAPPIAVRAATADAEVSVGMSTWTPPAGSDSDVDVDVDVDVEIEVGESLPPEADAAFAAGPAVSPAASPEEPPARTESESEERLVAAQPVSPEAAQEFYAGSADAERTPSTPPDVVQAVSPSLSSESIAASAVALANIAAPAEAMPAEAMPADALPHDSWSPPAAVSPQPAPQTVPELEMDRGSGLPALSDDTSATLEAAPASSRRPVEPEEQLADIAFGPGAPQPPRHTPPPESGRLPAAPPDEFDDVDVTGVRNAPTLSSGGEAEAVAARIEPMAPEASRPVLTATGDVADVAGPPPRFVLKTFAELLEATLSL